MNQELEDLKGAEQSYLSTMRDLASQLRDSGPRTKLRIARELLGMSQADFANYFDIPLATVRNWEADSRPAPSGTAKLFIDLLSANPQAIRDLAKKSGRGPRAQHRKGNLALRQTTEVA